MTRKTKWLPNLVLPLLAVVAMNGVIFGLGWNDVPESIDWLNPPGEMIGAVWMVLVVLMGIARYLVLRTAAPQSSKLARLIVYYILFCLSYPLYTMGLNNETVGFVGNAATFAVAAYLFVRVWPVSRAAAWCLSPALPWIIYATATMLA